MSASASAAGAPSYYGWGSDELDELGDGVSSYSVTPAEGIDLPGGVTATAISADLSGGTAIGSDHQLYTWGISPDGELGNGGDQTPAPTPTRISLAPGVFPQAIANGPTSGFAIGSDGNLYAWGDDDYGELGTGPGGSTTSTPTVVQLAPAVTPVAISAGFVHTLAIGSDGNLYAWGDNSEGELGDGTNNSQPSPEEITLAPGVKPVAIAAGDYFSLAIGSDGNLYAWGSQSDGDLGDGVSDGDLLTPTQVALPGGTGVQSISANIWQPDAMAIGTNGDLYSWGANGNGSVGNGGSSDQLTPAQLSLGQGISPVSAFSTGYGSYAVGSDGYLYMWGPQSATGLGTANPAATPTRSQLWLGPYGQVAGAGDYFGLSSPFALATTGTVSCAGGAFTEDDPPLQAVSGSAYVGFFHAATCPPSAYALTGGPAWLTINPASGVVSGVPPTGLTDFSYSVKATNSAGSLTAGPFRVAVSAPATVSGTVLELGGSSPGAGVTVQSCLVGGGCTTTTTAANGSFSLTAGAGSTIELTAFPPPNLLGQNEVANVGPLAVGDGLTGQTITLAGTAAFLPAGLTINGSNASPTLFWGAPAAAALTGACPDGLATVSLLGTEEGTDTQLTQNALLPESPVGSGNYSGTLPPAFPIHGSTTITDSTVCPGDSDLTPDNGPAAGGGSVIVNGSGFTGATKVLFGTTPSPDFVVESDTALVASVPPGTGDVNLSVVTPSGTVSLGAAGRYSYLSITSLSPAAGPQAGGTVVDISGGGFTGTQAVEFGATPATAFTVLSDDEIKATAPAGTGTVGVQVITSNGATTATPADQFSYSGTGQSPAARAARSVPALSLPPGFQLPSLPSDFKVPLPFCITSSACVRNWVNSVIEQILSSTLNSAVNQLESYVGAQVNALAQQVISGLGQAICTEDGQEAAKMLLTGLISPLVKAAVLGVAAALTAEADGAIATVIIIADELGNTAILISIEESVESELSAIWEDTMGPAIDFAIDKIIEAGLHAICGNPSSDPSPPTSNTLIDPSGNVVDVNGSPISGATVTILRSDDVAGPFAPVGPTSAGIQPPVNPETTGADGAFHWDVSAGYYQLQATAAGCYQPGSPSQPTVTSATYPVPPPQTGLVLTMQCGNVPAPPAPTVTSIDQTQGPPGGGTSITITGTGFTPESAVDFGANEAISVTFLSPTDLQATAPAHAARTVDVTVITQGGQSPATAADKFTFAASPVIGGLSPASGPAKGGTSVIISGHGFTSADSVSFGLTPATNFKVDSDRQITATAPPGSPGVVNVQVRGPGGVTQATAAGQYTYRKNGLTAQRIAFSSKPPARPVVGGTYLVSAVGGKSGNPVSLTVDDASVPGACAVKGKTVRFEAAGPCVIAANQAGNLRYAAAPQVTQTIMIGQRPGLVLAGPPVTAAARHVYAYAFLADGWPARATGWPRRRRPGCASTRLPGWCRAWFRPASGSSATPSARLTQPARRPPSRSRSPCRLAGYRRPRT